MKPRLREVVFHHDGTSIVPLRPWPQSFYISRNYIHALDAVELRPLTLIGIIKGVARNFVTMSLWRACRLLRILGFLKTGEGELFHWRHLTLACWRYWLPHLLVTRRLRPRQ